MANRDNLLPGDQVDWVRKLPHCEELVAATVFYKTPTKIAIRFDHDGREFVRFVDAERLRVRHGPAFRRPRQNPNSYHSPDSELAEPPKELLK